MDITSTGTLSMPFPDALFSPVNLWVIHVFFIVLATTTVAFSVDWILTKIQEKMLSTRTLWDDAAIDAAGKPMVALVWIVGLNIACLVIASHTESEIFQYANEVRSLAFIILIAWFLLRFVRMIEDRLLTPSPNQPTPDITSTRAIGKLARISVVVTAVLILLERLGYSIAGVLAFGGIGGIAVGFAAKDLLSNFFGGLMIFLDRPFSIGDWIRSPDRNIEGIVEQIGWRQTLIRTFDKRPLYVPNSTFASISVENPSRMTHRRIKETISLRHADREILPDLLIRMNAALREHPGLSKTEVPEASLDRISPSSMDIVITAFTHGKSASEFLRIKQDVLLALLGIIETSGARLAFPTQTLHLKEDFLPHTLGRVKQTP